MFPYNRSKKNDCRGVGKRISFGCYLPVTLFSKTKPKVGLLMIPKTCAYMWMIAMGLQLLF
ncbi:hypothetical protein DXD06_13570 [Roseburia sp. TF10-5]|nr:hypothetical protein DXD06_13570 [Roseburia sp. TF10-5]